MRRLGLFWVLLAAVCWGQGDRFVVFHSQPPGARLLAVDGSYLGRAGDKLPVSALGSGSATVFFQYPGYQPKQETLNTAMLSGDYPVVALSAATWWGPPLALARRFWPLLGLTLAGLAVAGARLRRRWVRQQELERIDLVVDSQELPRQVGSWRVVEKLGMGGMGVVLKAVPADTLATDQAVALKLMQGDLCENEESRRRFLREMKVCKALDHPNIVRVVDYGDHDGLLYLAMEFIEGRTLTDRMEGGLELADVAALVGPLASALAYAHERGVVHRDLKPDNVMLTARGRVVLMDFGLARGADMSTVTASGMVLGTPAYMAPEQVLGEPPDPAADQYSLALMVYEMLTLRRAFPAQDTRQALFARLHGPPQAPGRFRPGLGKAVDDVVLRALATDPEARFPGVIPFAEALKAALAANPPSPPVQGSLPEDATSIVGTVVR